MKRKRIWIPIVIIVVLAAAGGAYWWTQLRGADTVVADTGDTLQTTTARRGSLEIMTTAAGTAHQADFPMKEAINPVGT